MKKNLFIVISMMMVAFLATSCGPKTPEPVLLGDGNLTAYAVLQDMEYVGLRSARIR